MRSAVKKVTIGKKKDEAEKRTAGHGIGHDAGGAAAACDVRVQLGCCVCCLLLLFCMMYE